MIFDTGDVCQKQNKKFRVLIKHRIKTFGYFLIRQAFNFPTLMDHGQYSVDSFCDPFNSCDFSICIDLRKKCFFKFLYDATVYRYTSCTVFKL